MSAAVPRSALGSKLSSKVVINLKSPTPLSYGFLGVVVTSQF